MESGSKEEAQDNWTRLTPELKLAVAAYLHPNHANQLKLFDQETAACMRGLYVTLQLSEKHPSNRALRRALQPWPGPAFLAHFGRPEPWRSLTRPQRERLLCLAASSGHTASLYAALDNCDYTTLSSEVLNAAAAAGDLAGCQRLLREGRCKVEQGTFKAAGEGGNLEVLRLLQRACKSAPAVGAGGVRLTLSECVAAMASGACSSGQAGVLAWLRRAHGHEPGLEDAITAARSGQVALLEQLLMPAVLTGCHQQSDQQQWDREQSKALLLHAIAHGCPGEVLRRHYQTLWPWARMHAGADGQHGGEASAAAEAAARRQADLTKAQLLAAAAGSPTACWQAKTEFVLTSCLGPAEVERLVQQRGLAEVVTRAVCDRCHEPTLVARLRRLRALGIAPCYTWLHNATGAGNMEALLFIEDECGVPLTQSYYFDVANVRPHSSGCLAMLQLLRERGFVFGPDNVEREAECLVADLNPDSGLWAKGWSAGRDAALGWLAEVAKEYPMSFVGRAVTKRYQWHWSQAMWYAVCAGASLPVLKALRRRGAPLPPLSLAAKHGSLEVLEWVAAELEADGGRPLVEVG